MQKRNSIVIDFDDTLVNSQVVDGLRHLASARYNESVLRWAEQMRANGRKVIVHTARGMTRGLKGMQLLEEMADWFMKFQLGFDSVKFEKPAGCAYVDDLAVHVALVEQAGKLGLMPEPDEMLAFYKSNDFKRAYEVYLTKSAYVKEQGLCE